MGPVYVADPPGSRTTVALENLFAVFHERSGMTHILASPAPEILGALAAGPADADTLLARLRESHDLPDEDVREGIAARLAELEASGLVWRA